MDDKSVKINTTSKPPTGSVLSSTLDSMNEYDMNKLNDTIEEYSKKGK